MTTWTKVTPGTGTWTEEAMGSSGDFDKYTVEAIKLLAENSVALLTEGELDLILEQTSSGWSKYTPQ